jgi:hypothetical protein
MKAEYLHDICADRACRERPYFRSEIPGVAIYAGIRHRCCGADGGLSCRLAKYIWQKGLPAMIKTLKSTVAAGFLMGASLAFTASSAGAVTINFDDLGGGLTPISSGYNGLSWDNFYTLDAVNTGNNNGPNGYTNGNVSPSNVAFNASGDPASFFSSNPANDFTLNSFYLTGAWNNGLNVLVQAFDNGNLVNSTTLIISTLSPALFTLNWSGIDSVLFTSFGGTPAGYVGSGAHFALDDLTVNGTVSAVPVPAALPLLLTGLGGLVAMGRRRRQRARA